MTTIEMQSRVMAQLRSLPPGVGRSAAKIAEGMVGKPNIEPTLRLFRQQGLAVREEQPGREPDHWRLA